MSAQGGKPLEWVMGRDQYGATFHDLGDYPRRELMHRIGVRSARLMYRDSLVTSKARRVGYVVGGHWVELYRVRPW